MAGRPVSIWLPADVAAKIDWLRSEGWPLNVSSAGLAGIEAKLAQVDFPPDFDRSPAERLAERIDRYRRSIESAA